MYVGLYYSHVCIRRTSLSSILSLDEAGPAVSHVTFVLQVSTDVPSMLF
jgi:hypothetical protein